MNLPKKVRTYRDALVRSQQSSFVGREKQLSRFRRSLELAVKDELDRPIFNVSGLGGVGKSTLLRQFRQITHDSGGATAAIDETERTVPDVMGRLAEELEQQGHRLTQFSERYKMYRQRRQELESDPEAPQGFSAFLGRSAVKLARRVPGAGVVFDFVDEEIVAEQAGEWASYVARKLTNKDEVRLVQEPLEILTPLFLQEIGKLAEKSALTLCFDTYERTGEFLDSWLQDLINGRYGDLSLRVLIVIAGREALDKNHWALYEGLIVRFPLSPFTDEEARQYLAQKGITDHDVIHIILKLSGHLPLLVATLATEIPDDPGQVGEPNDTAIERFLKWVDDPKRRQVAIDAALPQCLNRDILAVLNGETEAEELLEWLKQMPFVKEHDDGWVYHEVVRTQMLRHKRRSSPQHWAEVHGKLADYYDTLQNALQLDEAEQQKDVTWQHYRLNVLYHRLCQAPQPNLAFALNEFLATLKNSQNLPTFFRHWAKAIAEAGRDAEAAKIEQWGELLVNGLRAIDEKRYDIAIAMYTELLNYSSLEAKWYPTALFRRGWIHFRAKQYPQSLEDLAEAIRLAPEEAGYWAGRGEIRRSMSQYDEALKDFNHAIELNPNDALAITGRGVTYRLTKCYDEAFNDFNRAIELNSKLAWAIAQRGITYQEIECYEKAVNDLNRAIELDSEYAWAIAQRGKIHRLLEHHEDALDDFNRAIELSPEYAWAINERGRTFLLMERFEEALIDFDRVTMLDPQYKWAIANRGITYRETKHYEEALNDLNSAVELDLNEAWVFNERGQTYQSMKRYDEALKDFNRAIELSPEYAWAIAQRGEIYHLLEQYEEALNDFNRAIELSPEYAWAIAQRGEIYHLLEQYEEALNDFNRAVELDPEWAWAIAHRGKTYRLLERYDEALIDFDRAIELSPDYDWAIANRGETSFMMKHYEEALNDFTRVIELDPSNAMAIAMRGGIYLALQRYGNALSEFNRAIALESDNSCFFGRALAYQALNQADEAKADFGRVIKAAQQNYEQDPEDWNNIFSLAFFYLVAGQAKQARHFYRTAPGRDAPLESIREGIHDLDMLLMIFPEHQWAKAAREFLQKQLEHRSNST